MLGTLMRRAALAIALGMGLMQMSITADAASKKEPRSSDAARVKQTAPTAKKSQKDTKSVSADRRAPAKTAAAKNAPVAKKAVTARDAGSGSKAFKNWIGTISRPSYIIGLVDSIPTFSKHFMWVK